VWPFEFAEVRQSYFGATTQVFLKGQGLMIDHAGNWAIAACDEHAAMQEFACPNT